MIKMSVEPIHDLVIRNGQIVDGTGAKSFEGDIAICNGVIKEIGHVNGYGKEEIDAKGNVVTLGLLIFTLTMMGKQFGISTLNLFHSRRNYRCNGKLRSWLCSMSFLMTAKNSLN